MNIIKSAQYGRTTDIHKNVCKASYVGPTKKQNCCALRNFLYFYFVSFIFSMLFILNYNNGGVESNWVHSACRPRIGLLYQPLVNTRMENLVEWWLQLETEEFGKNLPQCRFVHHKSHMTWPGRRGGKPATNRLSYGTAVFSTYITCCFWAWNTFE
jgi:hypothetical protein